MLSNQVLPQVFKIGVLSLSFMSVVACQSVKKAPSREAGPRVTTPSIPPAKTIDGTDVVQPEVAPYEEPETPQKSPAEKAKIGLILGPGGLRAFAHAGVLQEIHRTRLPVEFIAGLESGSLPAALYASKPQAFEAEWQMLKLKEEDFIKRTLMGGAQAADLKDLRPYFQTLFGGAKVDDAKLGFACLTMQNDKQQILILNKGTFAQSMPFCLSYPPLFRSFEGHQAAASQLGVLARYLRQKGATHIIYVDVIGERGRLLPSKSDDNVSLIWSLTQAHLASQSALVDDILRIQISDDITSFARRRDMIKQGKESAKRALTPLLKKYGVD